MEMSLTVIHMLEGAGAILGVIGIVALGLFIARASTVRSLQLTVNTLQAQTDAFEQRVEYLEKERESLQGKVDKLYGRLDEARDQKSALAVAYLESGGCSIAHGCKDRVLPVGVNSPK